MKLHLHREIERPQALAAWVNNQALPPAGSIRIDILHTDPRLILVPRLWVERLGDIPGSMYAAAASGVTWSAYAATQDSQQNQRILSPLPGMANRTVRPANAWQSDGALLSGDTFEISTGCDLALVAACADVTNSLTDAAGQILWFALDVFPGDGIAEDDSDQAGTYRGLLERVSCIVPQMRNFKVPGSGS